MSNFYYVYILFSQKDHKLYIGFTADLIARIKEHQLGRVTATMNRLPVILIHYEAFSDTSDVKVREKIFEKRIWKKKLKKRIAEYI